MDRAISTATGSNADRWTVGANRGQLIFIASPGAEARELSVPYDDLPCWRRDGARITFEEALRTLPAELHGWAALAAVIALRVNIGGLTTAAQLPHTIIDWVELSRRADAIASWVRQLASLTVSTEMPSVPVDIKDGTDYLRT